ncbi:hypothetical protein PG993_013187 [Apiospora rasikravindrae]|uniref:Uncharacterized protein n=1 Tax=Apiospora rasikravindrae TaxID=990691 RepID=A0ABR1RWZ0_9PEZI
MVVLEGIFGVQVHVRVGGRIATDYRDDTMEATGDGRCNYLAYPDGEANKCQCHDNGHCEPVCRDQEVAAMLDIACQTST